MNGLQRIAATESRDHAFKLADLRLKALAMIPAVQFSKEDNKVREMAEELRKEKAERLVRWALGDE